MQARALIAKLTEEKNSALQQNNKLRQELVRGMNGFYYMGNIVFTIVLYLNKSPSLFTWIPFWRITQIEYLLFWTLFVRLQIRLCSNLILIFLEYKNTRATLVSDVLEVWIVQELLKRDGRKNGGGVSFLLVILIGLIGIMLGYIIKKTWETHGSKLDLYHYIFYDERKGELLMFSGWICSKF